MIASKIGKRCLRSPRSSEVYVIYITGDPFQMPKKEISSGYVFESQEHYMWEYAHAIACHKGI
jgi:hypothetical protein